MNYSSHIANAIKAASLFCLLLLSSCNPKSGSGDAGNLATIDFEEDSSDLNFIDSFKDIRCIQLETTDESILGEIKKIIDAESNLIVLTKDNEILVFNHEDGKYLRHIGSAGEGPEEYIEALDMFYNPEDSTINVYDRMKQRIIAYKLNGEFAGEKTFPDKLYFIRSIERASDGTILASNDISGGSYSQANAFTMITGNKECEDIDPFAPVTVGNYTKVYANKPMSALGDEIKFVKFISDTIFSLRDNKISPLYKLNTSRRIISKEVASQLGFDAEFSKYCLRENLLEGIDRMFETQKYILLIPNWENVNGYYWIDKASQKGYHINSTDEVRPQIRKVLQGQSIIYPVGSNEKSIISCYDAGFDKNIFMKLFSEDPEAIALPESVVSAIKNVDSDGNPFLLIYSN